MFPQGWSQADWFIRSGGARDRQTQRPARRRRLHGDATRQARSTAVRGGSVTLSLPVYDRRALHSKGQRYRFE